jgi:hypothetical protein
MAGAASGLFVGAHVGSSIAAFTSEGFLLLVMIGGAVGFYLGIDTPALAFHAADDRPSKGGSSGTGDSAEFLTAVGTFLAALAALVSVSVIVFRQDQHTYLTMMIMLGWVVGGCKSLPGQSHGLVREVCPQSRMLGRSDA